jgi:hypothetical protein
MIGRLMARARAANEADCLTELGIEVEAATTAGPG